MGIMSRSFNGKLDLLRSKIDTLWWEIMVGKEVVKFCRTKESYVELWRSYVKRKRMESKKRRKG